MAKRTERNDVMSCHVSQHLNERAVQVMLKKWDDDNCIQRFFGSVAKVRGCLRGRANQNILPSGIRRKE